VPVAVTHLESSDRTGLDRTPPEDRDRTARSLAVQLHGIDAGLANAATVDPAVAEVELELEGLPARALADLGSCSVAHVIILRQADLGSIGVTEDVQVPEVPTRKAGIDQVGELAERLAR
jgi:hypothetical protein